MIYIGIDPGVSGATTFWDQEAQELVTVAHKQGLDIVRHEMDYATARDQVFAVIEKVASSPQMGVRSAFTFGQSYGTSLGMLTAMEIPFQEMPPQRWLRSLGIRSRRKEEGTSEWKRYLVTIAKQLFPTATSVITQQTADSFLITEFARRLHMGVRNA